MDDTGWKGLLGVWNEHGAHDALLHHFVSLMTRIACCIPSIVSKLIIAHHKRRPQVILRESTRVRQQHARTQMVSMAETDSRSMRFLTAVVPKIRLQHKSQSE